MSVKTDVVAELQSLLDQIKDARLVHSELPDENGVLDSVSFADQLGAIEAKLKTLSEPLVRSARPSFSNVSHGSHNEVGILQSLEVIDASQLKQRLVNTRNAVQANLVVQREKTDELVSLAKLGVAGSGIANQHIRTTRRPVGRCAGPKSADAVWNRLGFDRGLCCCNLPARVDRQGL